MLVGGQNLFYFSYFITDSSFSLSGGISEGAICSGTEMWKQLMLNWRCEIWVILGSWMRKAQKQWSSLLWYEAPASTRQRINISSCWCRYYAIIMIIKTWNGTKLLIQLLFPVPNFWFFINRRWKKEAKREFQLISEISLSGLIWSLIFLEYLKFPCSKFTWIFCWFLKLFNRKEEAINVRILKLCSHFFHR